MLQDQYRYADGALGYTEALKVPREAFDAVPEDDSKGVLYLYHMGLMLKDTYFFASQGSYLEEAILILQQAMAIPQDHDEMWVNQLADLRKCLQTRSMLTDLLQDLNEAVRLARDAATRIGKHDCGLARSLRQDA